MSKPVFGGRKGQGLQGCIVKGGKPCRAVRSFRVLGFVAERAWGVGILLGNKARQRKNEQGD